MKAHIAVLGGDGIGPEVVAEGLRVLRAVEKTFGHSFELTQLPFGGVAIDSHGDPLPPETLRGCLQADAILLGAIGGPKWSAPTAKVRPEQGLLKLRKELGVYANLRPVKLEPALIGASTLKPEVLEGVDLVFVRELTGGIYFGEKKRDATSASDLCTYTVLEVERITRTAARLAQGRRRKLTSIDKSNVLETSRLWREVVERVMRAEFPDVALDHVLVDAAAMHLIRRPRDFDVCVTEKLRCWRDRSGYCPRRPWATVSGACTSPFMARRQTLRARVLRILWGRFSVSPCCCGTRSLCVLRPRPSRRL
jgi:3-isopropylmalate dehydrogenase